MSELRVMGTSGDTKVEWDSEVTAEVDVARKTFDDLKKKGYLAFRTKKDGSKGDRISSFDKYAERIVLVPPMKGG